MTQATDEEIAAQVAQGNTYAFGQIVERYEARLLRYARKFLFNDPDAEDMVQEVFIKAYTNIRAFDTSRRFSPWIYRIAHNEFINAMKKRKRDPIPFFDPDTLLPHPRSREEADRDLNERERSALLSNSLGKLSAKYREALILYYLEDMDYKTIAEILHIPISTVGVRLRRARIALKQLILTQDPLYVG